MQTLTLELPCQLTQDELTEKGQLLSSAALRYDEVEDQKKVATKVYSDELKSLRGTMRSLSDVIRAKSEVRIVECAVRYHIPEPGMKRIVRLDTGEIIRDERMDSSENQNNLFEEIDHLDKLYGRGPEEESLPPEGEI